jgi:hypothetical chaperone protein
MFKPEIFAIDFGTSNTLVAAATQKGVLPPVNLDPASEDPTILKTVFYSPDPGEWYFGQEAIDHYTLRAGDGRFFRSVKKFLPEPAFTGTAVHGKFFPIHELIGIFLREVRNRANSFYGTDVQSVMLGRPAVFGESGDEDSIAEQRLKKAAEYAGFRNIFFCPEPVAAAYDFRHQLTEERTVLIADFGGGTSDFTVLKMGPRPFSDKDIMATFGVSIAGDRFDGSLMKHQIAKHFGSELTFKQPKSDTVLRIPLRLLSYLTSPADISFLSKTETMSYLKEAQKYASDPAQAQKLERLFTLVEEHLGYKLYKAIERTKINLTKNTTDQFEFLHPGIDLHESIAAADFISGSEDVVEKIVVALDKTLRMASAKPTDIDIVCCTGGTAKIPAINRELERRFGVEKLHQYQNFHSVIKGLAERAYLQIEK